LAPLSIAIGALQLENDYPETRLGGKKLLPEWPGEFIKRNNPHVF
jgi:hypothetical protein